eukprot:4700052-Pyramimonas_sp.AAC.1
MESNAFLQSKATNAIFPLLAAFAASLHLRAMWIPPDVPRPRLNPHCVEARRPSAPACWGRFDNTGRACPPAGAGRQAFEQSIPNARLERRLGHWMPPASVGGLRAENGASPTGNWSPSRGSSVRIALPSTAPSQRNRPLRQPGQYFQQVAHPDV